MAVGRYTYVDCMSHVLTINVRIVNVRNTYVMHSSIASGGCESPINKMFLNINMEKILIRKREMAVLFKLKSKVLVTA